MFDFLSKYQIILVTGPQRSGTTICARMIASDLKISYLDESLWGVWDGVRARQHAELDWPCVLQGPGLLKDVGLFNQPKCAIVVMIRDSKSIIKSQKRVNWDVWAEKELSPYKAALPEEYEKFTSEYTYWSSNPPARLVVAKFKYLWWTVKGKSELTYPNWYEVAYDLLASHHMWIPKERRVDFKSRQFREIE